MAGSTIHKRCRSQVPRSKLSFRVLFCMIQDCQRKTNTGTSAPSLQHPVHSHPCGSHNSAGRLGVPQWYLLAMPERQLEKAVLQARGRWHQLPPVPRTLLLMEQPHQDRGSCPCPNPGRPQALGNTAQAQGGILRFANMPKRRVGPAVPSLARSRAQLQQVFCCVSPQLRALASLWLAVARGTGSKEGL